MWIIEIVMLVTGLFALITGKVNMGKNAKVVGQPARIVGLILISPLILAFIMGFVIGFLIGIGVLPNGAANVITFLELAMVVGGLVWAYLYAKKSAVLPAPPPTSSIDPV